MEFWMVIGSEATPGWILRTLLVWHKLPYLGTQVFCEETELLIPPGCGAFYGGQGVPHVLKKR